MIQSSRSITVVACAALLLATASLRAADVKLVPHENRIHVEIGGKPFTDYIFAADDSSAYVRPYFYPVLAPDGTEVTADQTRIKGDHPHHRSLYVSHGDVNGADHWAIKGETPAKQRHLEFTKIEGDTIVQKLAWEGKDGGPPILNETRTIRFSAPSETSRAVDITSEFTAIKDPVKFGDTKEAGFCSVRVNKEITSNPVLTLSTGAVSKQNADKAAKIAGDENNVWGKEADWCDISGPIKGKTYGAAILDHPSNPYPARWHARRYGLVGANNAGSVAFDKNDPKAYTNMTVEPGKPTTLKFRVIIHEGNAEEAKIADRYAEFAK